jgi:serine phosphatase RsbU (regulator of sigma subunit)
VLAVAAVTGTSLGHLWQSPLMLDPLLAVLPALAGIGATTIRRPLAFGGMSAVAAVAIAGITARNGRLLPLPEATAISVVVITAISVVAAATTHKALTRRLTEVIRESLDRSTQRQLADVVSVAEVAQRAVLRPLPERVGPLSLGVVYLAAAAEAKLGGDLYDVAETEHGIRLIIGDVRGKGLGAVEVAADVLGIFREVAHGVHTLAELARRLDAGLARRWGQHEEFVTALLAEVDAQTGRLTIFNCGHPPAMLISAAGNTVRVLEVPAPAPPLGILTLGDTTGAGMVVDLEPGDQLLLYTDGVTEARDSDRDFYPLQERLAKLAAAAASPAGRGRTDGDLLGLLRKDLRRHVGAPLDDDAALLLVRTPDAWPKPKRAGFRAITGD